MNPSQINNELAHLKVLAFQAATKLGKLNPGHELLHFDQHSDCPEVWSDFVSRFGQPGTPYPQRETPRALVYSYRMYLSALQAAIAHPDAVINIVHEERYQSDSNVVRLRPYQLSEAPSHF